MPQPLRFPKVFGVVATGFGVVFVAFSAWRLVDTLRFGAAATRADGVVTSFNTHTHSRGSYPMVRFQVGEQTVEIEGQTGTSPPAYSIGEKVKVLYPAGKPEQGQIDSFVERFMIPLVFGGAGLIFGPIGVYVLRKTGNEKDSATVKITRPG